MFEELGDEEDLASSHNVSRYREKALGTVVSRISFSVHSQVSGSLERGREPSPSSHLLT